MGGVKNVVKILHESLGFLGFFVILCYLWPSGVQVERGFTVCLSVRSMLIINELAILSRSWSHAAAVQPDGRHCSRIHLKWLALQSEGAYAMSALGVWLGRLGGESVVR